jgi:hypothetical protein
MRFSALALASLVAGSVMLPVVPAMAAPDRETAMKKCKKEMSWRTMDRTLRNAPATVTQLESCIKAKMSK